MTTDTTLDQTAERLMQIKKRIADITRLTENVDMLNGITKRRIIEYYSKLLNELTAELENISQTVSEIKNTCK